jgi:hypothetical protein
MDDVIEQTVFSFAELSDRAKEYARGCERERVCDYEWWEYIYEDADTIATLLSIHITRNHPKRDGLSINFEGFDRGGHVTFKGYYSPEHGAIKAVSDHAPQDEVLLKIAQDLTVLQVTSRLQHGCEIEGKISHSRSRLFVEVDFNNDGDDALELALRDIIQRFADWIYRQLEAEYEYLTSDGHIYEGLAEHQFDENGVMI